MNKSKHKLLTMRSLINKSVMKPHTISSAALLVILLIIAQAASLQISTLTIENSGKISLISPLHVEGRYLKNELGQIVVLRGINKAGFEDFPDGWWIPEGGGIYAGAGVWDEDAVRYNLEKIKEWGSNVVRFHYSIDFWVRQDLYPNFRQHVREVTKMCLDMGLYVIWDPYSIVVGGEHPKLPWPPYLSNDTGSRGYSEIDIIPSKDAFVEHIREFADWLKDYPNVLFEHYSEPGVWIEPYFKRYPDDPEWQDWVNVTQRCINAIRSTGATQPIIVTGHVDVWCNLDHGPGKGNTMWWVTQVQQDGPTPIIDPLNNIIYCTHQYRASQGLGLHDDYTNGWTYEEVMCAMNYTYILDLINIWNKPLIITECGPLLWHTGEELIKEMEGWANQLRIYNQYGISYVAWVWTVPSHMPGGILKLTNGKWYCEPNVGGRILQYYLEVPPFQDTPLYEHPILEYAKSGVDWRNSDYRETGKPYLTTWATESPTRTLVNYLNFDEATKVMNITLYSMMSGTQIIEIVCGAYGEPKLIENATRISYDELTTKLRVGVSLNGNETSITISWAV